MSYCFAQNSVTLVFTGETQSHSYVRLDMVNIQNLSRGWSENIYYPDTVYTMNYGTGIEDVGQEEGMQVMPNPFDGCTRVNVFSAQNEEVWLTIVDVNGRKCAEYSGKLVSGNNYFDISLKTPQTYILSVKTHEGTHSVKMVNTGHAGSNKIAYVSNTLKTVHVNIKGTSVYDFELGDEMQYTGYAQIGDSMVQSAPIHQMQYTDEEITFSFAGREIEVATDSVLFADDTTRICYGAVNTFGQGAVQVGFCWDVSPYPTLANEHVSCGMSEGFFTGVVTGIDPFSTYYIRAYAINGTDTVYGENIYGAYYSSISIGCIDTIFIPDGVDCGEGCACVSPVTVSDFNPMATIQSADDILFVRIKLEHSFIGDIYMGLTCPNGQSVKIMNKYGSSGATPCASQIPTPWGWTVASGVSSGADFGVVGSTNNGTDKCDPITNPMGTPWNYCWSNNTTNGYQYANGQGHVYETVNMTSEIIDSTNTINMTQVYHPDQDFSYLIGCPINGVWSITIIDGWGSDNGWITEWEMVLRKRNSHGVIFQDASSSVNP